MRKSRKYAQSRALRTVCLLDRTMWRADYRQLKKTTKEIIDRYFFVGILEEGQASLDLLARILGKPRKKLPWANRTREDSGCDEVNLSEELIGKFREQNALDYLIYEYCVEKFRRNLAEHAVGSIL